LVTVFVRFKVLGDKEKVPEDLERFFDFLNLKGTNVEVKSRVFMELRQKEGS
jgi:hypothetical protein